MTINLNTRAESAGMRLDKMLQATYPQFSRSLIQRAIKEGAITLNGQPISVHHFLKAGDQIQGTIEGQTALICTPNTTMVIPIIVETDTYIVIDKPSGIIVHQADGHRDPDTIANWAIAYNPIIATVGDDPIRPGIVHRLDQDVSGCMIIAKTTAMFDHLKRAFQNGQVEKTYTALVYGSLPDRGGTIDFAIARSKTHDGRMAARPMNQEMADDEQTAITTYTVIKQFQQYALVEAKPKTGRTHQIRVHFHALGHPIVGDPIYQSKENRKLLVDRIFLHSIKISFTDLSGTLQTYTSPLPKELQQTIEQL